MRVEKNFNRKSATVIETQQPLVRMTAGLGVHVMFYPVRGGDMVGNIGCLRMDMTPSEALELAADLVQAAHGRLKNGGKLHGAKS